MEILRGDMEFITTNPSKADHTGRAVQGMNSPAPKLGSWVRMPFKAWMFAFILCLCVGSGLVTG
jgi:hypothetical protein